MERLTFLANRLNVEIYLRPMASDVALTRRPGASWRLTVNADLERHQRLPAAAMMLHVAELDWSGYQFRFRFHRHASSPDIHQRLAQRRRDYKLPYRLGLRTLMPDFWLEEKEREEADPRNAAEEAGVSLADFVFRVADWRTDATGKARATSLDQLIANGTVMRGSELALRPAPAIVPPPARELRALPDLPHKPQPRKRRPAQDWPKIQRAWEKQERERLAAGELLPWEEELRRARQATEEA